MTDQWDRFAARNRELSFEDFSFVDTVEVSTPSESYTAGEGYSTSFTSQGIFDVELSAPDETPERGEGGTTLEADLVAHVRDTLPSNLPNGLTEYGDSGEAAARFDPTDIAGVYEVSDVQDELNGLLRVGLVAVDER